MVCVTHSGPIRLLCHFTRLDVVTLCAMIIYVRLDAQAPLDSNPCPLFENSGEDGSCANCGTPNVEIALLKNNVSRTLDVSEL